MVDDLAGVRLDLFGLGFGRICLGWGLGWDLFGLRFGRIWLGFALSCVFGCGGCGGGCWLLADGY